MPSVFISHSGNEAELATHIRAALRGLKASVISYQHPSATTARNASNHDQVREHCSNADMFIQLVKDDLGRTELNGKPALQQELHWFLESMPMHELPQKHMPLILTIGGGTDETRAHTREYPNKVKVIPCQDEPNALEMANWWYSLRRSLEHDARVIEGHMDLQVGLPLIDRALSDALHHDEVLIPQKLLYTNPLGALFWRNLTHDPNSSVRRLYNTIDFESDEVAPIKGALAEIQNWAPERPICLIALGCGDGRREAILAEHLIRRCPGRNVKVLLVDISKTLVAMAARKFTTLRNQRDVNMTVNFALADFENPVTLSNVMSQWQPEHPVVILFLGNTLGNINYSSFFGSVSDAMKKGDLLLTEITMAPSEEALEDVNMGSWEHISPQHEDRFDFITGPVRELGVRPQPRNFRVRAELKDHCVRKTYGYKLDEPESAAVESILKHKHSKGRRLLLLRVDAFREGAIRHEISEKGLTLIGDLTRFEVTNMRGQEMGLFLAKQP